MGYMFGNNRSTTVSFSFKELFCFICSPAPGSAGDPSQVVQPVPRLGAAGAVPHRKALPEGRQGRVSDAQQCGGCGQTRYRLVRQSRA